MAEKRRFSPPLVGGSSLLVIFAVLCLVVFALLSLSTVSADVRLAEKSREFVTAYYAADSEAQRILAQLRTGAVPEGVTAAETEEGVLYRYECPLSEGQSLSVAVQVAGDAYRLTRWQVINTAQFAAEDTITVWDGEQETEGE